MNWYARFLKDTTSFDFEKQKFNTIFNKDNGTNKTRYAIVNEDKECYFIAMKPNDINYGKVFQVNKQEENKMFKVVEE